jgi:4-amino-4-deoxy-L-arabinose transferase-like glycosyltransferase
VESSDCSPAIVRQATRSAVLGFVLVALLQVYILSAGGVWPLPSYSAYYARQADAFTNGQAHLLQRPVPGLTALPDPYDPDANRPYRKSEGVHDCVLYEGKFYLYWGPMPAVLLVPFRAIAPYIAGRPATIGDEWLVLAFMLGTTLFVTLLIRRLYLQHFSDRPAGLVAAGIAAYGLATPTLHFLARPAVYEAAIAGGQCFLMLGLWLLSRAWPTGAGRRWWLLAGAALGAAVASRVSLAIGVTAVGVVVAAHCLMHVARGNRAAWQSLAAFATPLVLAAAVLVAWNVVRFGKPLEFGQQYQLTGANYRATPALFGPANAVPGLWSYSVRPVAVDGVFPFVRARSGESTFPDGITLPPAYESYEPIAGLLPTTPIIIFALIPLLRLMRRNQPRELRTTVLLVALAGGLGFAPVPFMIGSTHRYLMDLWPAAAVLAAVGMMMIRRPGPGGRPLRLGIAALLIWTAGVGVLLGHTGYYEHFRTWNKPWYLTLGGK